MFKESELNPNINYYHGTNNPLKVIDAPSPYKPFFISPTLEYAIQYAGIGQINDRSDFSIKKQNGYVYIIHLNHNNIKILDCTKDSEIILLAKYYPQYILDNIFYKKYSIWSIFKFLNKQLYILYTKGFKTTNDYFRYLDTTDFQDHFGNIEFKKGLNFLVSRYRKIYTKIYKSGKSESQCLYLLISLFNLHITKLGFNGFSNIERVEISKNKYIYGESIGLFDKSCILNITPKAISLKKIKGA